MSNILINCSNLTKGGGIQVAHSFLYEIRNIETNNYIVVCSVAIFDQLRKEEFNNRFYFIKYDIKVNAINAIMGKNKFLSSLVNKFKINIVFTIFGPSYWKPSVYHVCGFAKPQYIYKDSPFFKQISLKHKLLLRIKEFFHIYDFKNNNNVLITENKDVTMKLSKIINKKIFTVTNYYNQIFDKPLKKTYLKFEEKYDAKLLTVCANYPHKNLKIIPKVIEYLLKTYPKFNFKFILSISENEMNISNLAKKHIKFLGNIKIEDCPSLYNSCDYMFLPTLLECFSATYCEAMIMKKPILTSNLPFARGICNDAAVYFDPVSAKSIGDEIYNLHYDKDRQKTLINQGLERLNYFDNSKDRAEKYLNILEDETNYSRP
jgi:glycosyltransferase involved in cell wall biosynthesis